MSQNIPMKFRDWVYEWIHTPKLETETDTDYDSYDEDNSSDSSDSSDSSHDYSDTEENRAITRNTTRLNKSKPTKSAAKPVPWQKKVCWKSLSKNPNAIGLLETNPQYTDIWGLCANPNAVHLVEKHIKYNISIGKKIQIDKHFISVNEIDHWALSSNLNAIWLLEKYPKLINWDYLCANENAIHLIEPKVEKASRKVKWDALCTNMNAIEILEQNPDKIDWDSLSYNPAAIEMLEQNPDKINWANLSYNCEAIELLEQNLDKIFWCNLSWNPNALHLFENDVDKIQWIDWETFVENSNPEMTTILENNLHKLDKNCWKELSKNPVAISILEQNRNKINWETIFENPAIFVYDYEKMRMSNRQLKKEIIRAAMHPKRISAWLEAGMDLEDL